MDQLQFLIHGGLRKLAMNPESGIVDQNLVSTWFRSDRDDEAVYGVENRKIGSDDIRFDLKLFRTLRGDVVQRRFISAGEQDMESVLCKLERQGLSDTRRGAGNDRPSAAHAH